MLASLAFATCCSTAPFAPTSFQGEPREFVGDSSRRKGLSDAVLNALGVRRVSASLAEGTKDLLPNVGVEEATVSVWKGNQDSQRQDGFQG